MTLNFSKTFVTFSATVLLTAASAVPSDARPHVKWLSPTPKRDCLRTDGLRDQARLG